MDEPIKLIIFDLSGVCFSNEEPPFLERFAARHGLDRETFLHRYDKLIKRAEVHKLSGKEVWQKIIREFGVAVEVDRIIREMIAMKAPNQEVLQVAKHLKARYTVVYITNYNEDYWQLIKSRFDFSQWFSWGVVSYEIGVRKPARQGFEYILAKAGATPEETVFIDDSPQNLKDPVALGIRTIRFIGKDDLLKRFGLLGVRTV